MKEAWKYPAGSDKRPRSKGEIRWCMSIIPATKEAETGGWRLETSPDKTTSSYLKSKQTNKQTNPPPQISIKAKRSGVLFKWYSACLAITRS
jgi:hypothetical protein